MSEPIRFELSNAGPGYRVSKSNILPNRDDRLAVREDRATEADIDAVEAWLADELDRGRHPVTRGEARDLLALVFGEEASRV